MPRRSLVLRSGKIDRAPTQYRFLASRGSSTNRTHLPALLLPTHGGVPGASPGGTHQTRRLPYIFAADPGASSWRLIPSLDVSQASRRRYIPAGPPDRVGPAVSDMAASRKTSNSKSVPRSPFYKVYTIRIARGPGHGWSRPTFLRRSAPDRQMQRGAGCRGKGGRW